MIQQSITPPIWPETPHTVDSLAQAIRENSRPVSLHASALHLQLPAGLFVEGDTAVALEATAYKPRADVGEVDLHLPLDWTADPFQDTNWKLLLNSCRFLDRFFNGYESTGDSSFLDFPLRLVLDWHRFHIQEGNAQHQFAIDDMTAGIRASRFAFLAAKIAEGRLSATDEDLQKVAEVLLFHWALFKRDGYFKFTNHTLSALHGFMALFRVAQLEGEVKMSWVHQFSGVLTQLVGAQFDESGIHMENSPEYHIFVLKLFTALLDSGWYYEVPGAFHERLALAKQRESWLRFPDGRPIPFGDSTGMKPPRPGTLRARDYDKPEVLNHRCYHVSRCRDGDAWSLLAIKCGHERSTHRHEDDLSFIWSESGHDIIVDPGKYAYTKGHIRHFVKMARSHNVIDFVAGGKGARGITSNRVPLVTQHNDHIEICAEAYVQVPAAHVVRKFFFIPGRALLVVDRFSTDEAEEFTSRTNFGSDFIMEVGEQIQVSDKRGAQLHCAVYSSSPVLIRCARGVEEPQMEGWISRGYKRIGPCPTLAVSGSAKAGVLATAYVIGGKSSLDAQDDGLLWSGDDWEILVPIAVC